MNTRLATAILCLGGAVAVNAWGQDGPIVITAEELRRTFEDAQAVQAELDADPNHRAHSRGDEQLRAGNLDAALHEFEAALEHLPNDQVAYWKIGTVLARKGRLEEALEAYETSLSLNERGPAWPWGVYYDMGYALAMLGRSEEAEAAFARSLAANATAPAYVARGRAIMSRDPLAFDPALADFEAALELGGASVLALASKGAALLLLDIHEPDQGHFEHGCAALVEACDLGECRPLEEFSECAVDSAPDDLSLLDTRLFDEAE